MSKVREQSGLAQLSCSAVSLLVATLHLEQVSGEGVGGEERESWEQEGG